MKRTLAAALALTLALGAGCTARTPGALSRVKVSEAWARPSTEGAAAGAAYMVLESAGGDRLVGLSVPPSVARFAQIHETVSTRAGGGVSELRMRRAQSVELPAGERVEFAPGRRHVMLLELAHPLAVGDTISLALEFRRASPETVRVPVRDE